MDNDLDPAPTDGVPAWGRPLAPALSAMAVPVRIDALSMPALLESSNLSAERLRGEQEVAYFNELYLLAPVGYFLVGLDGTLLQSNLVGAALLGVARAHPQLHHFRNLVEPAFQADFDRFFATALNTCEPQQCRLRMLRADDGATFDVTVKASADGGGQACRVVVERADGRVAALERSEERLRRIVHNAEEGIWEIDAMARTTFVNPKMAAILGLSIEDMLGRSLASFMDEEGRHLLEQNIARRRQGIAERHQFKFIGSNGAEVWTSMTTNPIFDEAGNYVGALALVTGMCDGPQSTEHSWRQANFDSLTALPNRPMFMDRLKVETRKADRGDHFLALLLIDLDRFKAVNERHGHRGGDQVLVEASRRIASCVRAGDTLARLGGNTFAVILSGLDHVGSVERVGLAITVALAQPYDLDGEKAFLSASIGIALYPSDASELNMLLDHAGQAMHTAKHAGGERFRYYTPQLQQAARARQDVAAELREAIAAHQFEILYQPIVALQTGAVYKAEALLRWRHPQRGLLSPAQFIPFAESSGLIVEIGDWVFREAARQASRWQKTIAAGFQVCVNKSPVQFRRDADLYQSWLGYMKELDLPAGSIMIEITESVLFEGAAQVVERLRQCRSMGLQVALDDFGTGYSSLSHLKRFDIDYVKIDQSFVATLEDDAGDLALCEAIIVMAHKLGLKVVAEGVETKVQRALLVDAGCDYAQGYIFAHPLSPADFEAMATAAIPRLPP